MSFIAAATAVGGYVGLTGIAATIAGGALMGAGAGALYSGITGDGDIGKSALTGGILGGGAAYLAAPAAATAGTVGAGTALTGANVAGTIAAPVAEGALGTGVLAPTSGGTIGAGLGLGGGAAGTSAAGAAGTYGSMVAPASGGTIGAGLGLGGGAAATGAGIGTGAELALGTGALGYVMNRDNKKYGVPASKEYDGPLTQFKYDPKKYTALTTPQPSPAYAPQYANYVANPYNARAAAGGHVVSMAEGGIAQAMPPGGPVEQMSRNNALGQNQMFPQANLQSNAFSVATNTPQGSNLIPSVGDTNVDPYSGAERFAEGGLADTPQAQQATPTPAQLTQNSMNFNNDMMARLQQAPNAPQIQQALMQNPMQQAPVQQPLVQAQPYAAPSFTRVTPEVIPFGNPSAIQGTKAYNDKVAADAAAAAEAERSSMFGFGGPMMASDSGGGAAGGVMPNDLHYAGGGQIAANMKAVDDYVAQYSSDPASVQAKAKAGDFNAMAALNKINKTPNQNYAQGGSTGYNLGGYSDGGRLLKGPGDGMSDNIPATIGHKQPARLADGEFVVPADVVSHLGNGSTDAGAKHLYSMMDKVRRARTGNKKQGTQIKPEKFLKG